MSAVQVSVDVDEGEKGKVVQGGQPVQAEEAAKPASPSQKTSTEKADEVIIGFGKLAGLKSQLVTAYTVDLAGVEKPQDLDDLLVMSDLTKDDISAAIAKVKQQVIAATRELARDFEEKTGGKLIDVGGKPDFEAPNKEEKREKAEQKANKDNSAKVISMGSEVAGKMGIPNPDPGLNLPGEKKAKNLIDFSALGRRLADSQAGQLILRTTPGGTAGAEELLPGDWKSPPLLVMEGENQDPDVKRLGVIYRRLMPREGEKESDPAAVWQWFMTASRTDDRKVATKKITDVIRNATTLARNQIRISDGIIAMAKGDAAAFESAIDVIKELTRLVVKIENLIPPTTKTSLPDR